MKNLLTFLLIIFMLTVSKAQDQFILDSLLIEFKNTKEDTNKINILTDLSKLYFGTNLIKSLDYIDQALIIAEKSDNTVKHIKMHRAKGGVLTYIGNYDEAVQNFLEALKIAEETNELEEVFPLYINLGAIHARLREYDQAMEYYFKGLEVYNSLAEKSKMLVNNKLGTLYNNVGTIYTERNDLKTAEVYYLKSLELGTQRDDKKLQIFSLRNLGNIYHKRENSEKSQEYLNKGLSIAQEINDKDEIAQCYQSLSSYYIGIKNYAKALEVIELSTELANQIGSIQTKQQANKFLYEIYETLGDYKEAYKAYQEFKLLSDSLINENTISQITKAQMQYEYDKLEQERIIKQQKAKFITFIFISTLLLGLIIVFLLFILSRNHRKRIELEKDKLKIKIDLQNKELTTNVMYLLKKNEFINSVSTRLLNIKKNLKEENKQPIQKIIFDIQESIDKEVWEEFEIRFQNVHSEFYQNLQKKYPDLSPAERKLAAFLRLDMSSKDIASLTGQSIKSVEVARSRLRKKLEITSQDINLATFLLEL